MFFGRLLVEDQAWTIAQEFPAVPSNMGITRLAVQLLAQWQRDCEQHEVAVTKFTKLGQLLGSSLEDQGTSEPDAVLLSFRELMEDFENTRNTSGTLPCWCALSATEEDLLRIMELRQEHSCTAARIQEQMTQFEEQLSQVVRLLGEQGQYGDDDRSTNCSVQGSLSRASSIYSLQEDQ